MIATQAVHPVYNEILSVSGLPNKEDYDSSGAEYLFISFTPCGDLSISSTLINDSLRALE
jgi:hypothetical protein